jgi:phage-related protein (TIGR01555 family)
MNWFTDLFQTPPPPTVEKREPKLGMKISPSAITPPAIPPQSPYQEYEPPPGVVPKGGKTIAMDDALTAPIYGFSNRQGYFGEGLRFMGYPYLAELTQRPEYRKMSETIAEEMTRKWVDLYAPGDKPLQVEKLKKLRQDLIDFNVQDLFRWAKTLDGFYGRSQIYIDTGDSHDPDELLTPLTIDKAKIGIGALRGFKVIDPTWTAANTYNSRDPLDPDFYKPTSWFVMGKRIHATRLITMVGFEVPDILKPAYNFGGLSLSQMAKPYVDNWLRTRQSVSDLVHAFTVFVLKTNLAGLLSGGAGEQEIMRMELFNRARDSKGLFVLDKDTEEFDNVSVPLGTLDKLQAQSQEQMSSVSSIPLVKLLGITPSGLNASSDGEIRVFYDHILALQQKLFRVPLTRILQILQLNRFGVIDPDITFKFNPLWQLDEAAEGTLEETDAKTDIAYMDAGVLAAEEVRKTLAEGKIQRYSVIDFAAPAPMAPVPQTDDHGDDPDYTDAPSQIGENTQNTQPDDTEGFTKNAQDAPPEGMTIEFKPDLHPRSTGGIFVKEKPAAEKPAPKHRRPAQPKQAQNLTKPQKGEDVPGTPLFKR